MRVKFQKRQGLPQSKTLRNSWAAFEQNKPVATKERKEHEDKADFSARAHAANSVFETAVIRVNS
jgi:hypothetical protein